MDGGMMMHVASWTQFLCSNRTFYMCTYIGLAYYFSLGVGKAKSIPGLVL